MNAERIHKLKTWPCYFEEIFQGRKQFEVRRNDRDFRVGDILLLEEYDIDSGQYTGRHCHREISYILTGNNPFIDFGDNVIISFTPPCGTKEIKNMYPRQFVEWCLNNTETEWEMGSDKIRYSTIVENEEIWFNTIDELLDYWKQNIRK